LHANCSELKNIKIIAFTHQSFDLDTIGKFHIPDDLLQPMLTAIKAEMNWDELVYLTTCNRVEFLFGADHEVDIAYLKKFVNVLKPDLRGKELTDVLNNAQVFEGTKAITHLFNVASSLDSLVVGEREIITQVRNAYEKCKELGLTGDLLRLVIKKTIQSAKEVYSSTDIAKNPVSVVSLAYRKLKELNAGLSSKILIVGAGQTNTSMARYLKKHGFTDLTVFSRTLAKAEVLAGELNGEAYELTSLASYRKGFDVIISCTGSSEHIITKANYINLLNGDQNKKIVIDLAIPNDFDTTILDDFTVNLIAINNLKDIAEQNLKERRSELAACRQIITRNVQEFASLLKERQIELAMRRIPEAVKEIRKTALNGVFAKDLEKLDASSRETLEKVLSYVEKKYISVPMKLAKEVMLNQKESNSDSQ